MPHAADRSLNTLSCESAVFISDLHLSDQTPQLLARFEAFCSSVDAQWLVVLGDLFEGYCGDDDRSACIDAVEQSLVRLHQRGVHVAMMHGNRDFMMGQTFASRCYAQLLQDPCVFNGTVLLSHGDRWCTLDLAYQQWRSLSRSADWQARFLAQPLATRQAQIQAYRAQSKTAQMDVSNANTDVVDEVVVQEAIRLGCTTVLHGHTHRPSERLLHYKGRALGKCVLGDWEVDVPAVAARWERGKLGLFRL
jgi:UDP-2,3-diacylglucosamine hydrolase